MRITSLVSLAFVGALVAWPLLLLFAFSLFPALPEGSLDGAFSAWRALVDTPGVAAMLGWSLLFATLATAIAFVLGVPVGFVLARTDIPGKRLIRALVFAPIATPPYVYALCFCVLLMPGGFVERCGVGLPESIQRAFFSIPGIAAVMAFATFGYVAIAVENALLAVPARLEHAAASLGGTPRRVFARVVLPLLKPAIGSVALLVFLDALANFGVPAVLGPRAGIPLLPAEIHALVTSWPVDLPLATALSSLLVLVAVVSIALQRTLLSGIQAPHRGQRSVEHQLGRRARVVIWLGLFVLGAAVAVLPYGAMVTISVAERLGAGDFKITLDRFAALFSPKTDAGDALVTSFTLAAIAAAIATLGAAVMAYAIHRDRGPLVRLLDGAAMLPRVIPKIAMAVAFVFAFNLPVVGDIFYGNLGILVVAYVALYFSDALRFTDAAMGSVPQRLEHAALALGATPRRAFRRIVLPLLRRGMLAGFVTTFAAGMRDLVASVMLLPPGAETAGSYVFHQFEQGDLGSAMAMATLVTVISTGATLLLGSRSGSTRRAASSGSAGIDR